MQSNKLTMTFVRLLYISNYSDQGVANIKFGFKQISKYICIYKNIPRIGKLPYGAKRGFIERKALLKKGFIEIKVLLK